MFRGLAEHPRIVVTGPQRSGTTIATHMIAVDLGYRPVDEREYGTDDEDRFRAILQHENIVAQAPCLLKAICDDPPPATLVVLVRRALSDIRRSAERIGWYDEYAPVELARFGVTDGDPARVKYEYWAAHTPPCSIEVHYETLRAHPLWVPPEDRVGWHPKQIRG